MLFFKKTKYTPPAQPNVNIRNFRFLGEEAEVLGLRLDAARAALASATKPWSKNYWQQTIERLVFQWQQLPVLHDADARMSIVPRWTVNYEFYELAQPHEYVGVTDRAYNKLFRENINLDTSWHSHREARLARAQY